MAASEKGKGKGRGRGLSWSIIERGDAFIIPGNRNTSSAGHLQPLGTLFTSWLKPQLLPTLGGQRFICREIGILPLMQHLAFCQVDGARRKG